MASTSILTSIKKNLGIDEGYTAFDPDVVMYINTVFSTLSQLGVGPINGFHIEDKTTTWDSFLGVDNRYNFIQTYMTLKVRLLFDPPTTSFTIKAIEDQITEFESRIHVLRETDLLTLLPVVVPQIPMLPVIDGGGA